MSSFIIDKIYKSFNGIKAIDNFSFAWSNQNIVGLIGPNGAGKTTLFNILTGYLPMDKGGFLYMKEDLSNKSPHYIVRRGISRTFQELRLLRQIPVIENMLLFCQESANLSLYASILKKTAYKHNHKQNIIKIEAILDLVGLIDKRYDLASSLSYGQQKLLTIGCCLATDAKFLLLDEPLSGINPDMIEVIIKLLYELINKNKKLLIIEHNIGAVRTLCDWVIFMDEGKNIMEGAPEDVLNNDKIINAYID
jgi:ABC-type branched-subunit amino acid transport system ATPase component